MYDSFFAKSENLYAEFDRYTEATQEHSSEAAQDFIRSLAQREDSSTLSAEELDDLIDIALNDEYFEDWLEFYNNKQDSEKQEFLFQDRRMVWYAIRYARDEDLVDRGVDILHTLSSIEVELI
jgi:hypothetical protein